eukprot:TRINITY_DN98_c2_g1_i2.p1 TRINITY_DN98_c2_g1~~TRINITY_DN98_c2_g1_i2.p1  ORF type:complete len:1144 (-),score=448.46 TRINITY_DN98_c2_g1_i2:854-4285(-)
MLDSAVETSEDAARSYLPMVKALLRTPSLVLEMPLRRVHSHPSLTALPMALLPLPRLSASVPATPLSRRHPQRFQWELQPARSDGLPALAWAVVSVRTPPPHARDAPLLQELPRGAAAALAFDTPPRTTFTAVSSGAVPRIVLQVSPLRTPPLAFRLDFSTSPLALESALPQSPMLSPHDRFVFGLGTPSRTPDALQLVSPLPVLPLRTSSKTPDVLQLASPPRPLRTSSKTPDVLRERESEPVAAAVSAMLNVEVLDGKTEATVITGEAPIVALHVSSPPHTRRASVSTSCMPPETTAPPVQRDALMLPLPTVSKAALKLQLPSSPRLHSDVLLLPTRSAPDAAAEVPLPPSPAQELRAALSSRVLVEREAAPTESLSLKVLENKMEAPAPSKSDAAVEVPLSPSPSRELRAASPPRALVEREVAPTERVALKALAAEATPCTAGDESTSFKITQERAPIATSPPRSSSSSSRASLSSSAQPSVDSSAPRAARSAAQQYVHNRSSWLSGSAREWVPSAPAANSSSARPASNSGSRLNVAAPDWRPAGTSTGSATGSSAPATTGASAARAADLGSAAASEGPARKPASSSASSPRVMVPSTASLSLALPPPPQWEGQQHQRAVGVDSGSGARAGRSSAQLPPQQQQQQRLDGDDGGSGANGSSGAAANSAARRQELKALADALSFKISEARSARKDTTQLGEQFNSVYAAIDALPNDAPAVPPPLVLSAGAGAASAAAPPHAAAATALRHQPRAAAVGTAAAPPCFSSTAQPQQRQASWQQPVQQEELSQPPFTAASNSGSSGSGSGGRDVTAELDELEAQLEELSFQLSHARHNSMDPDVLTPEEEDLRRLYSSVSNKIDELSKAAPPPPPTQQRSTRQPQQLSGSARPAYWQQQQQQQSYRAGSYPAATPHPPTQQAATDAEHWRQQQPWQQQRQQQQHQQQQQQEHLAAAPQRCAAAGGQWRPHVPQQQYTAVGAEHVRGAPFGEPVHARMRVPDDPTDGWGRRRQPQEQGGYMPAPQQQQRYMVPPQQRREYMQVPPAPAMARQYHQQEPLRTPSSYPDSHHYTQQQQQQRFVVPPQQQQNFMPQRPSAPQRGAQYQQQGRMQAPPPPQWEQQRHQQHAYAARFSPAPYFPPGQPRWHC